MIAVVIIIIITFKRYKIEMCYDLNALYLRNNIYYNTPTAVTAVRRTIARRSFTDTCRYGIVGCCVFEIPRGVIL